jgi:hypothetical protein
MLRPSGARHDELMRPRGDFVSQPDRCRVTVFTAAADDEALVAPPRRIA